MIGALSANAAHGDLKATNYKLKKDIYNMKFYISSLELYSRLQSISRVINSKNALPILDCFLFDLSEGTMNITASDS